MLICPEAVGAAPSRGGGLSHISCLSFGQAEGYMAALLLSPFRNGSGPGCLQKGHDVCQFRQGNGVLCSFIEGILL